MHGTELVLSTSQRKDFEVKGLRIQGQIEWLDDLFARTSRVTIGRTRQRDIRIRDPSVSRNHCSIERTVNDRYMIIDHGSTNGLLVSPRGRYSDYKRKEWKILELGMVLRLGRVKVVPVNRNGDALLQVVRHSELLEHGEDIYGSQQEASRHLGVAYAWLRRWLRKIREKR